MKKAALVIAIVFFTFWGLWIIAIPERFISDFINDSLKKYSISIDSEGLEKGVFYSIRIKNVKINNLDNTLILIIHNLKAGINFTSFLKLSPGIDFKCNIEKGKVNGNIGFKKGVGLVARIKGSVIDIGDLPGVGRLFGIGGTGDIDFDLLKKNKQSEIKFSLSDAKIIGFGLIPLDMFKKARGELVEENGLITIKSLVMEGDGIYARVKGYIRKNERNVNIEVMVNSSSDINPSYLAVLEKFKVSPGYYVIK
ncbi:MAG: type II secretion system protein GspN [Proteobacteria bacterium]|nr:type II secretion system protein GspN [Pseudomonadota bacterium]MBU4036881.1 type II secretion system protein GspN [Pseudomonadota bacterium]